MRAENTTDFLWIIKEMRFHLRKKCIRIWFSGSYAYMCFMWIKPVFLKVNKRESANTDFSFWFILEYGRVNSHDKGTVIWFWQMAAMVAPGRPATDYL